MLSSESILTMTINMEALTQAMQLHPTILLASSFILIFLHGLLLCRRCKLPYPPGPKGLPIIGNMLMLNQMTHRGLAKLAKKYGGIIHLRMGFVHMVAVQSAEDARQVLQIKDNVFSNRPATIAISYLTYDRADMAFAHYTPIWRQMRKICTMRLFSRKRAESWKSVRDEVNKLVRTVTESSSTPVNLGQLVFKTTMNITYRAAFGVRSMDGRDEFVAIMQEYTMLFGAFNVADFIPFLCWIDPQGINSRLVKARESLDKFIDKVIGDHVDKQNKKSQNGEDTDDDEIDMVDELLSFHVDKPETNESDDLRKSVRLTKDNIKAIIMDIMFGGTETVGSLIEWAMAELMRSPEDLQTVQKELANVVGLDRRVRESDLDNLTYLRCVIKETLRLHPPVPLLLHETAEDAEVSGYFVPRKTRVMINVWAIGRDPKSWADPDTFRPSRFLNETAPDVKGSNFELLPFGSGRRSCPGMYLGFFALEYAVANLLHCFNWELPNGMKPADIDMDDIFGLTAAKTTRLMAVPSPRLPQALY